MELNDAITTFDTLYTTNEIQILKLALPLLSASIRPYAATLIKIKELKYCLDLLPHSKIQKFSIELDGLDSFVDNALPYCNKSQRELFSQIRNIKSSMKMFEKMQCMMSLMGDETSMDPGEMFKAFQSFSSYTEASDMNKGSDLDITDSDSLKTDNQITENQNMDNPDTYNQNIIHFNDYQNIEAYEHNKSNSKEESSVSDMNEKNDTNVSVKSTSVKASSSTLETMLQSALSAEQKEMFNMFKSRFDTESQ